MIVGNAALWVNELGIRREERVGGYSTNLILEGSRGLASGASSG